MRISRLKREAAAYVILKRKGQSINNISCLIGRSSSFVHRILKRNYGLVLRKIDLRKLPRICRMRHASRQRQTLLKLAEAWRSWILGEGEKPP